jgi:ribonuclease Y
MGQRSVERRAQRELDERRARAMSDAAALVRVANDDVERFRRASQVAAREQTMEQVAAWDRQEELLMLGLQQRAARLDDQRIDLDRREAAALPRTSALTEQVTALDARKAAMDGLRGERDKLRAATRPALERQAGESAASLRQSLVEGWLVEARAVASARLRAVEQITVGGDTLRDAQRLLDVAMQRYSGHYLIERSCTTVPLGPAELAQVEGLDGAMLRLLEEGSGAKLTRMEPHEAAGPGALASIRIEGMDGVAREVARRAIRRILKAGAPLAESERGDLGWIRAIAEELDREIFELGKRAFKELSIPLAHPDIVRLVGRLNYRTSYTQNQWKHAMEASVLCGMIAEEMGLDVKLARRATLLHDIGKSLTHEIDGSHAVIGADIARRLGESEIVANAIGAHHLDEPFDSVYAYLVAACDALSGARPGARRQTDETFAVRVQELERIASSFPGVLEAHAVHGGREIRIMVAQGRVDDLACVEMSAAAARRISEELTFPGQIKVTVVRQFTAVETAG